MSTTHLRVSNSTKKRLGELGKFGDSYDAIIQRILDRTGKKSGNQGVDSRKATDFQEIGRLPYLDGDQK